MSLTQPHKLFLLLLVVLAAAGCQHRDPSNDPTDDVQSFNVRGKIVSTENNRVLLDHEAVPGFMDAMTMAYKLRDPSILPELHPGDRITAKIIVPLKIPNGHGYTSPMLDKIVVIAQARPDYKPMVQYHVPAQGDEVPDFTLLNQSGRTVHLSQFKGKVLLATFIYTRCQMADFCPRMSTNFADIDKALATDPGLYARTHLLSISFDPAYDTPAVLKRYGASYTGRFAKEDFGHWDFAAPPQKELPAITQFFNVGIQDAGDPATLTHSLSTVLIGKDGKVVAWYPTNDWKPADVLAAVRSAAG